MAREPDYILVTGGTKREGKYCIAFLNKLHLSAHGSDREDAVEHLLAALKVYMEANKRLRQIDAVAKEIGYSGGNPKERMEHLLAVLTEYTKANGKKAQVPSPIKEIQWEDGPGRGEYRFALELS
jgi:hypothetical protein